MRPCRHASRIDHAAEAASYIFLLSSVSALPSASRSSFLILQVWARSRPLAQTVASTRPQDTWTSAPSTSKRVFGPSLLLDREKSARRIATPSTSSPSRRLPKADDRSWIRPTIDVSFVVSRNDSTSVGADLVPPRSTTATDGLLLMI